MRRRELQSLIEARESVMIGPSDVREAISDLREAQGVLGSEQRSLEHLLRVKKSTVVGADPVAMALRVSNIAGALAALGYKDVADRLDDAAVNARRMIQQMPGPTFDPNKR